MNWTKAAIAGAVGGFVVSLYNYLLHGVILAGEYAGHPAFSQTQANPGLFVFVAIVIGLAGGVLFAKTRSSWQAGVKGGVTFGFYLGLISLFAQFYWPLVLNQFAYWMTWVWGVGNLIGWMVFGAVAGAMYKTTSSAGTT